MLLNSGAMGLIMSSEFARKQGFRLKKIKRLIEYIVKVNIYYQEHRESMEIDVISRQKQSVILGMLWLAYHNSEIDWRIGEVKITK